MTDSPPSDALTLQEMQAWLRQEIEDSNKARELRVKQATTLVEEYGRGKLTPAEAMNGLYDYDMRWGDALFGTHATPGVPDERILQAIDEARNPAKTTHVERARRGGSSTNTEPVL